MKSNRHIFITYTAVLAAILLASCVKDELYNTPHPDSGAVVVTADWSDRNSDADIPQAYILSIDGQEQEVSKETNILNRLLPPGKYTLAAYNKPDQVTVADNTVSVNATSAKHINPMPGYLFASVQDINVVADDTLRVTARMKQLIRRLNLELTATEGDYSRVQSATATLSGVA